MPYSYSILPVFLMVLAVSLFLAGMFYASMYHAFGISTVKKLNGNIVKCQIVKMCMYHIMQWPLASALCFVTLFSSPAMRMDVESMSSLRNNIIHSQDAKL